MSRLAIANCVLTLLLATPSLAWGQRPSVRPSRYEPAYGPTISPYLQYSRPGIGVVNNYYNFVRPRVQLRSSLRMQERQIDRLNREVQQQARTASQIRDSGVAPTGINSRYMNFLHYYPSSPLGRR